VRRKRTDLFCGFKIIIFKEKSSLKKWVGNEKWQLKIGIHRMTIEKTEV